VVQRLWIVLARRSTDRSGHGSPPPPGGLSQIGTSWVPTGRMAGQEARRWEAKSSVPLAQSGSWGLLSLRLGMTMTGSVPRFLWLRNTGLVTPSTEPEPPHSVPRIIRPGILSSGLRRREDRHEAHAATAAGI